MTSTGNRRIISKMLSESTRFRKKLATGLRDFLKKQSQEKENASERLNVENKQRGILRKRLWEATSETEKSSLVQQLTSDTPERKKRADELHNLRAKNDEYIAVSAKLQELQKKRDEYLKVRSDLKKKSR